MKKSRFTWLLVVGFLLSLAVLAVLWWMPWRAAAPDAGAEPRTGSGAPSVLLITLDTLRADAVGAYGATGAETPTLDRLADDGILYENAYAVAPITLVAHASMLTGVYPPVHGVRNNGIHALADSWTTLPERLGGDGVRTAAVVGATVLDRRYGLDQGFEVYDDDLRAERSSAAAVDRPAGAVTDAAIRWLAGVGGDERFFLWVHYFDPHAPYAPPEPYRSRFAENPYAGEVAYLDSEIGRLLRQPRLAADDRLAVIVLADHGESLGEHGEETHGMLAYDSTLHVPWIVRAPGGRRGERSRQAIDQVDLLPTVLAMMGVAGDPKLPGRDLLATGSDGELAARPLYAETFVPFYTYGWSELRSLREGAMKYIEAPRPELYDYRDDPEENHDLLAAERRTAGELKADLERLFPAAAEGEAEALVPDREAREQLRALGYLGSLGDGAAAGGPARDPKEMMAVHLELEKANLDLVEGRTEAAIRSYRHALEADPNNLRALSDLATALAQSGRLEDGVRTLEKAIEVAPGNAQLHLQRAAFAETRGDVEGALRHLDLALELAPALLEARLEKTAYLGQLGRLEEAAEMASETLDLYPDDAEANVLYAQLVELPRGDVAAAEPRLRDAVERDPYLAAGWRALIALLERQGETAAARDAVAEAVARLPDDAGLRADLGRLGAGSPAAADDAPSSPGAQRTPAAGALDDRNRRAIEAYRAGDRARAVAMLEALLGEHPDYAPGWVNLSWLALDREDWAAAARYARRALDVDPTLTRAWENLGQARQAQGRGDEAEQAYRQAVAEDAGYWQARLRLALLLLQSGRADEASRELSEIETRSADDAEARFQLARVFEARGDAAAARRNYEAVVRLAPSGGPLAQTARERLRSGL